MLSSQLQDFNKKYITICKNLGDKFLQDYDKFPVLFEYKAQNDQNPEYLLKCIAKENPLYVLTDERLFDLISKSKNINISNLEIASSKGYWCSLGAIKFFFCNKYFQNDQTKMIFYKRSLKNSCSIKVHLP